MNTITRLQADILGVNRDGFSVYVAPENPSLPDYEGTVLNLLVGRPTPTGKRIPEAYKKELAAMGLVPADSPFSGGLLPVCVRRGLPFSTVMSEIHLAMVEFELTQDFTDYHDEYWEARWLSYRKPEAQSLSSFHLRLESTLKRIGASLVPDSLQGPDIEYYAERHLLAPLGTYMVATSDLEIPEEHLDEWAAAAELNWLKTLEARAQVFDSFSHQIDQAADHQLETLLDNIDALRPSITLARTLLLVDGESVEMARARVNLDTYEYCVALVCEQDHNRLLDKVYSRIAGKNDALDYSVQESEYSTTSTWASR